MVLILTEKESMANAVAESLNLTKDNNCFRNNDIICTWAAGHLVEIDTGKITNSNPWEFQYLPYLPEKFPTKVISSKKRFYDNIKNIVKSQNVTEVVNFCDAAQEGELIYRLIANQLDLYADLTQSRMWTSSLTNADISNAYINRKPLSDYDNLYQGALARSHSDWLFGINLTIAASIHFGFTTRVGRVKMPILKIITERYLQHQKFIPKPYFTIKAEFTNGLSAFSTKKYDSKSEADDLINNSSKQLVCSHSTKTDKTISLPKLYNLNSFQIDAFNSFGYKPTESLSYIQSLYEKTIISYPRTDSQYLPVSMKQQTSDTLNNISSKFSITNLSISAENNISAFNDSKVSDHYAIIPLQQLNLDLTRLSEGEKNAYFLIVMRFIQAFSTPVKYVAYNAKFGSSTVPDLELESKDNVLLDIGFISVQSHLISALNPNSYKPIYKTDKYIDNPIELSRGDVLDVNTFIVISNKTKPRPLHSYASLLHVLDSIVAYYKSEEIEISDEEKLAIKDSGIGTPATRGDIIEAMFKTDFIANKAKNIIPSENGIAIYNNLNSLQLLDPTITAKWQSSINGISTGASTYNAHISMLHLFINTEISNIRDIKNYTTLDFNCTACDLPIKRYARNATCDKNCKPINTKILNIKLSDVEIKLILGGGITDVKNFVKKDKKKFTAALTFKDDKLSFHFEKRKVIETDFICPSCKNKLVQSEEGSIYCNAKCLNGKYFSIPKILAKTDITHLHPILLNGGQSEETKFTSAKKKPFKAKISIDKTHKIAFTFKNNK